MGVGSCDVDDDDGDGDGITSGRMERDLEDEELVLFFRSRLLRPELPVMSKSSVSLPLRVSSSMSGTGLLFVGLGKRTAGPRSVMIVDFRIRFVTDALEGIFGLEVGR